MTGLLASLINTAFWILIAAFIGQAIISWLYVAGVRSPVILDIHRTLTQITQPILAPLRRYIRPIGGTLDITPMIAIFGLYVIRGLVLSAL